jgi:hypothetical protein
MGVCLGLLPVCQNQLMTQARGPVVSSIAALGSLVAAMSCCLPVGTFLVAAGAAGAARILNPLRPWLFAVSIAALILGFVQAYGKAHCSLRRNPVTVGVLWISAALILVMFLFPQVIAGFLADKLPLGSVK